ncbi:type II toxin-antitoxin system VapC family toxin [Thermococcus sp.]|uniref:type II toxin-antitoxin system VapC family toxin n=1 Tax=Thermococcus sp. TaxID=35749 RepID=UPI0026347D5E|nr:type II toxin-antitoxin system VapC family toxin [Thermococcus sp.]
MRVFYDSNVFLKFLGGESEAGALLDLAFEGKVEGVVSWVVLSEVIFGYLRLTTNMRPYDLKRKLPKMNVDLTPIRELLEPFQILEVNPNPTELFDLVNKSGLLPNDALIALTCLKEGIPLVSFDSDFERVAGLRRGTTPEELPVE